MQVRVYATLRDVLGGSAAEVQAKAGDTIDAVLKRLVQAHPALGAELYDENGVLQTHMHVFVGGRNIRFLDGPNTVVDPAGRIDIFPPVGGG